MSAVGTAPALLERTGFRALVALHGEGADVACSRRHPMRPSDFERSAFPASPGIPADIRTRTTCHFACVADHERICRPLCFHRGRQSFGKCPATSADRARSHKSRRSCLITPGRDPIQIDHLSPHVQTDVAVGDLRGFANSTSRCGPGRHNQHVGVGLTVSRALLPHQILWLRVKNANPRAREHPSAQRLK